MSFSISVDQKAHNPLVNMAHAIRPKKEATTGAAPANGETHKLFKSTFHKFGPSNQVKLGPESKPRKAINMTTY